MVASLPATSRATTGARRRIVLHSGRWNTDSQLEGTCRVRGDLPCSRIGVVRLANRDRAAPNGVVALTPVSAFARACAEYLARECLRFHESDEPFDAANCANNRRGAIRARARCN